jgi:type I site-specific restriction endonuclease
LRKISEERTRKEMIDPQLEQAGWYLRDHSKVKIKIPHVPPHFAEVDGYDTKMRRLDCRDRYTSAVLEGSKSWVNVR